MPAERGLLHNRAPRIELILLSVMCTPRKHPIACGYVRLGKAEVLAGTAVRAISPPPRHTPQTGA